jgi:hypothetical protein
MEPASVPSTATPIPEGDTMIDPQAQHEAIARLFELVRAGDVDSLEFSQLDSLVYSGLERTYQVNDEDHDAHGVVRTTAN